MTIRVGLLGFGLGGRVFHAPLIAATPGLELAAIVTRDPDRAARARATYPGASIVPDLPSLLAAGGVDLVVVATPNAQHVPQARAVIDAGLPVVVDKPFAPSAAEGRDLIAAAEAAGVALTVFQNRRWDGDLLTVRRLLDSGALGQVHRFESRFEVWKPALKEGSWKEESAPGAGVLYDLGAHVVDQALLLFGPAEVEHAELGVVRSGSAVPDDAFVALRHLTGVRSHLWMSRLAAQPGPRFRVLGADAAFVKHGLDGQEPALAAGGDPAAPGWGAEPAERWGVLGAGDALSPVPTEPGAYLSFYAGVAAALRDGTPMPVDPAGSLAGLEIIEAAGRAAGL
ncbi:Gfo/Idh/MocA family protein [Catenuloplanes atrovinosus]|uniref:Dehydrogenase n=1 Tax=Catenuloplanes atrovinosus TaxID=137266 RepID=A0AAE3YHS5_9ACTN|nr:Gfo/Idh/MocA family oxidoreductase [Catenuloplanes atrovinosus]MDR7273650.1 putative dehydrogenase [Catenuloplanes atrovinosus]